MLDQPLFLPFDPHADVEIYERHLPHWRQAGRTYFVTFRLGDSLPRKLRDAWGADRDKWLAQHPNPHSPDERREYKERFSDRIQFWLDKGYDACWLNDLQHSADVENAMRHFDGFQYQLGEYVIMPNHVHALVRPSDEFELSTIVQAWKSVSARGINRRLNRKGKVWQEEYFDHIVRDEMSLVHFRDYIRQNPMRASLPGTEFRLGAGTLRVE